MMSPVQGTVTATKKSWTKNNVFASQVGDELFHLVILMPRNAVDPFTGLIETDEIETACMRTSSLADPLRIPPGRSGLRNSDHLDACCGRGQLQAIARVLTHYRYLHMYMIYGRLAWSIVSRRILSCRGYLPR